MRYQLTEKALVNSFPELQSQKVMSEDTSHIDHATTFVFSPYEAKDNLASFYAVVCPAELRQAKAAACKLISNQGFYSDNPSEHFDIESTSDVKTALWAHSAHRKVNVVSENEWMARRLKDARRVNLIEINGMIVKFSYGSDGCWHQVLYRIVGNNEKLEFLKTDGGSCI